MSKLVAVYGDPVQLEDALGSLESAGLSDLAEVIGDGQSASGAEYSGRSEALHDHEASDRPDGGYRERREERIIVPPVAANGSGVPPTSPAVLAPLAVPPGGSEAVGVVGDGPGTIDTTNELERVTGAGADEVGYYADVINGGGSLLVIEGDASELDRAEAALREHAGQGMVRH